MSDAAAEKPGENLSIAHLAAEFGLYRVGARPAFFSYIATTWHRRDFIWHMAKFRVMNKFSTNRLGLVWLLVNPVFNALIYGAIFGILQGENIPPDYPARVVIGVFIFTFFRTCFTHGAKSITSNQNLVQSLSFPRITLPLSVAMEELLSIAPAWALLFIIMPIMGHPPSVQWLLILPVFLLSILFNTGIALISARITVHLRDLTEVIPLLSRILFYTSGVLFDVGKIFAKWPMAIAVYDFHPIYQMVQLGRHALIGIAVDPLYWVYFSAFSVVVFGIGLVFFWSAEERYGR
ncbi:MAG: ABC transporter permease [Propionibacteriaceae bacterium]|nr:ABC transporter permease [Propionibacteriaceae bacterium]